MLARSQLLVLACPNHSAIGLRFNNLWQRRGISEFETKWYIEKARPMFHKNERSMGRGIEEKTVGRLGCYIDNLFGAPH